MRMLGLIVGSILIALTICFCEYKDTCCFMCVFIAWWMVWYSLDAKDD